MSETLHQALAAIAMLACTSTPCLAGSALVVPLEESARDDRAFTGFGLGLSAIVEADLVDLPGLDLDAPTDHVERAHRTAEAGLTRQDGVNSEGAARLARDLELDWAFTGTWGVEERTLTVTYRIIDTQEQRIAEVEQSGPASDFQTVHKTALLALLSEVGMELSPGIQRRIQGRVLTENAEAVAAWGRGLKALAADDPKAAVKHLEQALAADPAFSLGSEALADARIAAERERLEVSIDAEATRTEALLAALARTPVELELAKRTKKLGEQADLLLRFALLTELSRPCQAEQEMHHYLLRNQGRFVKADKKTLGNALSHSANRLKVGRQLEQIRQDIAGDSEEWEDEAPRTRKAPRPVASLAPRPPLADFTLGSNLRVGLLREAISCAGPSADARLDAIERVRETLTRIETRKVRLDANSRLHLELRALFETARRDGWSEEVSSESARLATQPLRAEAAHKRDVHLSRIEQAAHRRDELLALLEPWTVEDWSEAVRMGHEWTSTTGACSQMGDEAVLGGRFWRRSTELESRVLEDGWVHRSELGDVARALNGVRLAWLTGCLDPERSGMPTPSVDVATRDAALSWFEARLPAVRAACSRRQIEDLQSAAAALRDAEDPKKQQTARLVLLKRATGATCLSAGDLVGEVAPDGEAGPSGEE